MKILPPKILFSVFAFVSTICYAQSTRPVNRFGIEIGGGIAQMHVRNTPDNFDSQITSKVGSGLNLALIYEIQYQYLLLQTGFGINYSNTSNILHSYGFSADVMEYATMHYHYLFSNYTENTSYGVGYIPIKIGVTFKYWYILAGVKIGIFSFANNSSIMSDVKVWATDQEIIDPLEGMPTHGLQNLHIEREKASVEINPFNTMLSAEIGLHLKSMIRQSNKKMMEDGITSVYRANKIHYRLAFFADYGLNNLHNYIPNPVGYNTDNFGGLVAMNGINQLTPYSIYGYKPIEQIVLNNLLLGVKISVQVQLPRASTCRCER